jgi:uncharacterized protein (DUF2147 family)
MRLVWLATLALSTGVCLADGGADIVGTWKTYDDETGRPAALVRIFEEGGAFAGRVVEVLEPDSPSRCAKCPGEWRDLPIAGLLVLTGLRWQGERYAGGDILDPDNGRLYRVEARLMDHGRKLSVRGYLGLPILGRDQVWVRQQEPTRFRVGMPP